MPVAHAVPHSFAWPLPFNSPVRTATSPVGISMRPVVLPSNSVKSSEFPKKEHVAIMKKPMRKLTRRRVMQREDLIDSLSLILTSFFLSNLQCYSFCQLALLDGLSFNAAIQEFGLDQSIIKVVLSSKETDTYTKICRKQPWLWFKPKAILGRRLPLELPTPLPSVAPKLSN